ncbi:MAG: hypothetical protein A3H28_03380 [Acidobacteria bacterium RIFCSPLOWO2_02_FULL_61_28]|nr:MAG: hypothetical protein A3H28_03380 [Acidobacteria bacterium RIFCSPLOWO2_02_FULL_61_28]
MRRQTSKLAVSLLCCIGILVPIAFAQLPTATILGVVKDGTGAVVPGASLTARSTETGQTRTVASAGDGSYRFSGMPVGGYEVRVEQSGFQAAVRSGLTLSVGQEAVVNFTLEVGAVTQTIAVTAEAPLVNTTSGSLGALVDERRVAELPLNGRNYVDLTLLQPGVQQTSTPRGQVVRFGVWFSSGGAPLTSNNYLLDGAPMVGIYGGTSSAGTGNTLGLEGVREWRVVTNSFPAEYGTTMGSQMLIVTKSGTNNFHGSLFEYLRNSALDARNFFDYKTAASQRRLPQFTRNNFGGSFGGPIVKDKTFFHLSYEGLRERLGLSQILDAIGPDCRGPGGRVVWNGQGTLPAGSVGPCPQLGANPSGPNTNSVTISPAMAPFLPAYAPPNLPNNQFTFPYRQPTTENWGQVRGDQTFSDSDSAFFRYTIYDSEQVVSLNYPQFTRARTSRDHFATLSESHVFTPALLNTFRVSYSRMTLTNRSANLKLLGPESWLVRGLPDFAEGLGSNVIGGLTTWGPEVPSPTSYKKDSFIWSDDLFYTRGRHALKFGTLINRYRYWLMNYNQTRGQVNFANLAGFLQGQASTYVAAVPATVDQRYIAPDRTYQHWILAFYLQDDVRVRSNFTLNLGLRYEVTTEFQDRQGRATALVDIRNDDKVTVSRTVFKNSSLRNFGPRFGFAWDVRGDGRTAVRGGFGLLYDLGNLAGNMLRGICSVPLCNLTTVPNPAPFTSFPLVFPPQFAGRSLKGMDYHAQQPHMLQYNLTVERQLPWDTAVTLAYAGSRGLNLYMRTDGNPTVPQVVNGQKFWTGTDPRVNRNWNDYELYTAAASSWYNSMQFSALKRLSRGLQLQSSYTWSKVLNLPSGQGVGDEGVVMDPSDIMRDWGPAEFDVSHNWRFNAMYRLPDRGGSGGVAAALLNGWGLGGILSLQTGYPVYATMSFNRSRSNRLGGQLVRDRPDLAPGVKTSEITSGVSRGCGTGTGAIAAGTALGDRWRWYDPCAFTLPLPGYLGNAGRHIVRGPGLANVDFSLRKDTPLRFLGESGQLEFRAEFFNIFNRVNFQDPSASVFAGRAAAENPLATAGRITATRTTARQVQLALRLSF